MPHLSPLETGPWYRLSLHRGTTKLRRLMPALPDHHRHHTLVLPDLHRNHTPVHLQSHLLLPRHQRSMVPLLLTLNKTRTYSG